MTSENFVKTSNHLVLIVCIVDCFPFLAASILPLLSYDALVDTFMFKLKLLPLVVLCIYCRPNLCFKYKMCAIKESRLYQTLPRIGNHAVALLMCTGSFTDSVLKHCWVRCEWWTVSTKLSSSDQFHCVCLFKYVRTLDMHCPQHPNICQTQSLGTTITAGIITSSLY